MASRSMNVPPVQSADLKSVNAEELAYIIHHVVLPPYLPQHDDYNPRYEEALLRTLVSALHGYQSHIDGDRMEEVNSAISMMKDFQSIHSFVDGFCSIDRYRLLQAFQRLTLHGGAVPLHVHAQNAGIIFSKVGDSIHVELFELSPLNEDVMSIKGRLIRSFPGSAVAIPLCEFEKTDLQDTIAKTLEKMSFQGVHGTKPEIRKAGDTHGEIRDTTDPKMVTQLLLAFLISIGKPIGVQAIQKKTRDDVLWKNAKLPWHRSPMWLLLRVSLHLHFSRRQDAAKVSMDTYKDFMVFFATYVLDRSLEHKLSCELLFVLSAKLSRRSLKMTSHGTAHVLKMASDSLQRAEMTISKAWTGIQLSDSRARWIKPCSYNVAEAERDTRLRLQRFDAYLEYINNRKHVDNSRENSSTCPLPQSSLSPLDTYKFDCQGTQRAFQLLSFEAWVAEELDEWLLSHITDISTCEDLGTLIQRYHEAALVSYEGNPEALANMILVIMEMWVACDKAACDQAVVQNYPLLRDYEPGIPREIFQCLLLPSRQQMVRLRRVEEYLSSRSDRSLHGSKYIFRDARSPNSFPVEYFDLSIRHQRLMDTIVEDANEDRKRKCQELRQKQEEYKNLMREYDLCAHEYNQSYDRCTGELQKYHKSACRKCRCEQNAISLSINVHEWPLSANEIEAKTTVFELEVPKSFGNWRDITLFVLLDVLGSEHFPRSKPRSMHPLRHYTGLLLKFDAFGENQRIILLSENKPNTGTHRGSKRINTVTESEICVANGLMFHYFDERRNCFIEDFEIDDFISSSSYELPTSSSMLQKFIRRPASAPSGPDANIAITTQWECPDHLTLDEYKALATLPLGHRIQWHNILRELKSPSVDFRKGETVLIVLQCIFQAGPVACANVLRDGHLTLHDEQFCITILQGVQDACILCKENWQSACAISVFISITARVMSLSGSSVIALKSLEVLATARHIVIDWIANLNTKTHLSIDDNERNELRFKAVRAALICTDSFNVDDAHLTTILKDSEEAAILIRCSVIIHQGNFTMRGTHDRFIAVLHHRWQSLSYRCLPKLRFNIIERNDPAIDKALREIWSVYEPSGAWIALREPYDHWLESRTRPDEHGNTLDVQLSILTGELLVNGYPLNKLPADYEADPIYPDLFGRSTLEVMPTTVPGMQFSAKQEFAEHKLHFGMSSDEAPMGQCRLLIRAIKDERTYDLVPHIIFDERFPFAFIHEFVHWYNREEDYIELCPKSRPWSHSDQNWRLVRGHCRAGAWSLTKNGASLLYIHSRTATTLSQALSSLEDINRIHIIVPRSRTSLELELPRLQLRFYVDFGHELLKSKEHRGYFVDNDQSIGALVGLESRLVLKSDQTPSQRMVIIPNGDASFAREGGHVRVGLEKSSATRVHVYSINQRLGRLDDDGSLQSKLWLCYLHALTSFYYPDPLTHHTGTEAALSILRSASVSSFDCLSQENIDLLLEISCLTPERAFYPEHLQVMQTVSWNSNLGFWAQHGAFHQVVRSIFNKTKRLKKLYLDTYIEPRMTRKINDHLRHRDNIRSATFKLSDFGAEDHETKYDRLYSARDTDCSSTQAVRAFALSSLILLDDFFLHDSAPSDLGTYIWNFLLENAGVLNPSSPLPEYSLGYDGALVLNSNQDLATNWIKIHEELESTNIGLSLYPITMWLATLAFDERSDFAILQIFAAFYKVEALGAIRRPPERKYHMRLGFHLTLSTLTKNLHEVKLPLDKTPDYNISKQFRETMEEFRQRQSTIFRNNQDQAFQAFAERLQGQWPCEIPDEPPATISHIWCGYVDVDKAMAQARETFKFRYDNLVLNGYLDDISRRMPRNVRRLSMPPRPAMTTIMRQHYSEGFISKSDIFNCKHPSIEENILHQGTQVPLESCMVERTSSLANLTVRLERLAESPFERDYVTELRDSAAALQSWSMGCDMKLADGNLCRWVSTYHSTSQQIVSKIYDKIEHAVVKGLSSRSPNFLQSNTPDRILSAQYIPRLCSSFLLRRLNRHCWKELSDDWKDCITGYAVALTHLQRAERMQQAIHSPSAILREIQNAGHENWDPRQHPESLLLEVESNIMIRNVQAEIASQMRSPPSDKNATMQLIMGGGKSSVITPDAAASLADGTRLVRVIVAKAQSRQMHQMLVSKLGGLLNRQVYRLPISRAIRLDPSDVDTVHNMMEECRDTGGILLVQPEHILSFKLMGIEYAINGDHSMAEKLLATQRFLTDNSRDIVDESDENFSVKFELIYTMGTQRPIEFSPDRWSSLKQVLDIFSTVALKVAGESPSWVEIHELPGRFPRIRILRQEAQGRIRDLVAEQICEQGLRGFPITRQPERIRRAVQSYISQEEPESSVIDLVEDDSPKGLWRPSSRSFLLLLRGLLSGGVLGFCFGQKRWRVDYGLDPNRKPPTRLALPFRAKDNPSPRSEFSHPEVIIILTLTCYYYKGLDKDEMYLAFDHLLKEDQRDLEYQEWVKDAPSLPPEYQQLVGVNLEDRFSCEHDFFPHFRYSKGAIDYFVTKIVFPKEIREFPNKLSASGWDIGEIKKHPTTGFSGTNDSKVVLPVMVDQLDLEEHKHTNALVLEYLLRPENSVEMIPQQEAHKPLATTILDLVAGMSSPTRVILDVGAQILELDNLGVAKQWLLSVDDVEHTQAVIFFDDNDELFVLDRKGQVERLQISPYLHQPDLCLVFLDEAHTRGTDLKLPCDYRAAVTLGAKLTKDRLVQACMRMRQLGKGQSVVFCVSNEIEMKIRETLKPLNDRDESGISVLDILTWTVKETFCDLWRSMTLWATQGRTYQKHEDTWARYRDGKEPVFSAEDAKSFLEDEAQTLEHRYRPYSSDSSSLDTQEKEPDAIAQRCQRFRNLQMRGAALQEEQERELSPEIEQEREDQKPPPIEAAAHSIHPDLEEFVTTGIPVPGSEGYMPAFQSLRETSAGRAFDVAQFPSELLVTMDFARTTQGSSQLASDLYQRPVQWILTGTVARGLQVRHMVIISPFEANHLIVQIRESICVRLHIYNPRLNLGYPAWDKLDLYSVPNELARGSIPRSLTVPLNLFSGQLYMDSLEEYRKVCDYLGLAWLTTKEGDNMEISEDGFILRDQFGRMGGESGFRDSPIEFLRLFLTQIRRNCEGIDKTHMGKVLDKQLLTSEDFKRQYM
ncbi:hypothetical protein F5Y15DRAFT_147782 [Xylariaceae sp. FL0016]|nr:hypothetical protein F5Y15DRAFT_147782 [Xylariaceae sp. FL0016]